MHRLTFLLSAVATLVLIFACNNVTAAPHPCLWMLDLEHMHKHQETPVTTAKPEVVEDFSSSSEKKTNQLEKFIWGPSSSDQSSHSRSSVERMISSYVQFLVNAFNMF